MATRADWDGAWIIAHNSVRQGCISRRGNLVDRAEGSNCFALANDEQWPEKFATREAAEAALDARQEACAHTWRMISHEERECAHCGAIEFVPDI